MNVLGSYKWIKTIIFIQLNIHPLCINLYVHSTKRYLLSVFCVLGTGLPGWNSPINHTKWVWNPYSSAEDRLNTINEFISNMRYWRVLWRHFTQDKWTRDSTVEVRWDIKWDGHNRLSEEMTCEFRWKSGLCKDLEEGLSRQRDQQVPGPRDKNELDTFQT